MSVVQFSLFPITTNCWLGSFLLCSFRTLRVATLDTARALGRTLFAFQIEQLFDIIVDELVLVNCLKNYIKVFKKLKPLHISSLKNQTILILQFRVLVIFTWTILGLDCLRCLTSDLTVKSRGSFSPDNACLTRSMAITVPVRPTPAEQCNKIGISTLKTKF